MPRYLLRGRVRVSTVLITLVFLATLTTYLLVRPVPKSIIDDRSTTPSSTSESAKTPPPAGTRPTPTTATSDPTPTTRRSRPTSPTPSSTIPPPPTG